MKGKDQFNSIHEKLIAQWKEIQPYMKGGRLYFTAMDNAEDLTTISYLRDTAEQGGIRTEALPIKQIGWNERAREFRDLNESRIDSVFSLYPWEWLLKDFPGPLLERLPSDGLDGAHLENDVVEQSFAGGAVGDVSRTPQSARSASRRPAQHDESS